MDCDGLQQRIDRLGLDAMRRVPGEPLESRVFGQGWCEDRVDPAEQVDDGFVKDLVTVAFVLNRIAQFETEVGIDLNRVTGDSRFFFGFALGSLQVGFSGIAMSLG